MPPTYGRTKSKQVNIKKRRLNISRGRLCPGSKLKLSCILSYLIGQKLDQLPCLKNRTSSRHGTTENTDCCRFFLGAKASAGKLVHMKVVDDKLRIIDDVPSSAVEMAVKDKVSVPVEIPKLSSEDFLPEFSTLFFS